MDFPLFDNLTLTLSVIPPNNLITDTLSANENSGHLSGDVAINSDFGAARIYFHCALLSPAPDLLPVPYIQHEQIQ
jgi:hypothetical protein